MQREQLARLLAAVAPIARNGGPRAGSSSVMRADDHHFLQMVGTL